MWVVLGQGLEPQHHGSSPVLHLTPLIQTTNLVWEYSSVKILADLALIHRFLINTSFSVYVSKEVSGVLDQGTILFKAWIDGVAQLCRGGSGIQEFGSKALSGDLPMAQKALTGLLVIHEAARTG